MHKSLHDFLLASRFFPWSIKKKICHCGSNTKLMWWSKNESNEVVTTKTISVYFFRHMTQCKQKTNFNTRFKQKNIYDHFYARLITDTHLLWFCDVSHTRNPTQPSIMSIKYRKHQPFFGNNLAIVTYQY